ncbi:MAG: TIGR04282 family arsenosugar biosynthesis glycosyltransferase [Gammaproteobacteria bacterium]
MKTPPTRGGNTAACCVVLMMKSAARSKRRLAELIGAERATQAAQRLLDCAREDIEAWPGPTCVAPSATDERADAPPADAVVVQRGGNLGERLNHVNEELIRRGFERQLFIGIDCPSLDVAYLERAATALEDNDTVLGPAADGGVVLMGVRGRWPPLADLPWSTNALFESLRAACVAAGSSTSTLPGLHDVDTLGDLVALRTELESDPRPGRRSLVSWLVAQADLSQ